MYHDKDALQLYMLNVLALGIINVDLIRIIGRRVKPFLQCLYLVAGELLSCYSVNITDRLTKDMVGAIELYAVVPHKLNIPEECLTAAVNISFDASLDGAEIKWIGHYLKVMRIIDLADGLVEGPRIGDGQELIKDSSKGVG